MLRLVLYLAAVIVLAIGFSWLADRPGDIVIAWQGYRVETNVFHAAIAFVGTIALALIGWSTLRHIWESPASVGRFFQRRRQSRGLDALSSGMIAIGAGDQDQAVRFAVQARKSLPNEPLTHLLRAQAAQLTGDKATSRRIFEAMLNAPDTEQLGLRGLFLEAAREGEEEAALQFAQRAIKLNPKLEWSVNSLFDLQCKRGDWRGALDTLAIAKRYSHVEKASANRRRAVLLTAQAQDAEDSESDSALNLALEAHALAPDLIPAAAIAGRLLASRSNTPRAAKIIQKTWKVAPHPDLAVAYAYARLGDSPRDRLERVGKLAALNLHSIESPIAVATAAIEAKDFASARHALEPLLERRLTQRVCTLMARLESEELGNKGRVREWLARAVNAPRDPAWTADGVVSETWAAVSPVSGALDAFQWRVPVETLDPASEAILASKLEEFVALGAPKDVVAADGSDGTGGADAPLSVDLVDVFPQARDTRLKSAPARGKGRSGTASNDVREEARKVGGADDRDDISDAARGDAEDAHVSIAVKKERARHNEGPSPDARSEKPKVTAPADAQTRAKTAPRSRSTKQADADRPEKTSDLAAVAAGNRAQPAKPKPGAHGGKGKHRKKADDARIFVSPRAPDDPGTDAAGDNETRRRTSNPYPRRNPN